MRSALSFKMHVTIKFKLRVYVLWMDRSADASAPLAIPKRHESVVRKSLMAPDNVFTITCDRSSDQLLQLQVDVSLTGKQIGQPREDGTPARIRE